MNVAILASGTGTNALTLIEEAIKLDRPIRGLICDKLNAPIIDKAKAKGIEVSIIPRVSNYRQHFDQFEGLILKQLHEWNVDWIFLAGFMAVLGPNFLKHFWDFEIKRFKVVNIHPSLLPAYKGLHAYQMAFKDHVTLHGATVHFVDEGVDCGPIISKCEYPVDPSWTLEQFIEYGKNQENQLYKKVFKQFIENNGKLK